MKLLQNIKLMDGTVIDKGSSVRMNYKEGPHLNVEISEGQNVKKIFWITEDQAKHSITRNQVWTKKNLDEYNKDLKELWFETDSNNDKKIIIDTIHVDDENKKKRGRPKKIK